MLASLQSTLGETAAHLGVSVDTLRDFFHRYTVAREVWDDCRLNGASSIRAQLFKNLTGKPEEGDRPDPENVARMDDCVLWSQGAGKVRDSSIVSAAAVCPAARRVRAKRLS